MCLLRFTPGSSQAYTEWREISCKKDENYMKYILCATCENGQLQMISSRNSPDIFQISYVEKSWELCKQSRATVGVCTVYLAQYQELQGRILGSPRNKKQWKDDTHSVFLGHTGKVFGKGSTVMKLYFYLYFHLETICCTVSRNHQTHSY